MREITETEACERIVDLLDAAEREGETFVVIRDDQAIAVIAPPGVGADFGRLLAEHAPAGGADELRELRRFVGGIFDADIILPATDPSATLPSERGETWNDTEAINRHREMTPSQRLALAIEASRAALLFADGKRALEDR